MVQALLNNINISNNSQDKHISKSNSNNSGTDFQTLFEKQSCLEKDPKKLSTNKDFRNNKEKTSLTIDKKHKDSNNSQELTDNNSSNVNNKTDQISSEENNEITKKTKTQEENIEQENILLEILETELENTDNITAEESTDIENDIPTEESEDSSETISNNIILSSFIQNIFTKDETKTSETNTDDQVSNNNEMQTLGNLKMLHNIENLKIEKVEKPEVLENLSLKTENSNTNETQERTEKDIVDEDLLKDLKVESIDIDNENSDSETNSESESFNQSPQEHAIKATIQNDVDFGDIKTEIKVHSTTAQTSNKASVPTANPARILEQISKQMESLQNSSKVNIVLNPESLGKVSIQLINTKEGLSAQFTVATQEARNLIMKGLDGLKDSLIMHGVNVDNVSVKTTNITESELSENWTDQEGSRGGNKEQNQNKNSNQNKEEFDKMMNFIEKENGKV